MGEVDGTNSMYEMHQNAGGVKDVLATDASYGYAHSDPTGYVLANSVAEDGSTDQTNGDDKKEMSELEKYWKTVNDNPQDFTGWTYLLQYVEQENELEAARKAFDAFFKYYPYCYGYWKKYADLEKKNGNIEVCQEVFERGMRAIPLSVDLWHHYITFFKAQYPGEDSVEKVRALLERSLLAAGLEFRSDRLWEMYVAFETERKNMPNVLAIFDRLITTPTQLYSHQFEKFEEFVRANNPADFLSPEELVRLKQEIVKSQTKEPGESNQDAPLQIKSEQPGEDGMDDTAVGSEVNDSKMAEDEITTLRDKIIETRRGIHKANEEEVSKRWNFEEGIKRPYFHVKPLERTQLNNWREYLEFEIENGDYNRVCILFERSLIACALYEEFWLKYAKYQEPVDLEAARDVYCRACTIHLLHKPSIHLCWASFEERLGMFDKAIEILDTMEKQFPSHLPITFRRINLVRRQGKHEEADRLYKQYIEASKTPQVASLYALKQARYRHKVLADEAGAVQLLKDAIEKDKDNARLYMQLIDIYYQTTPFNEDSVIKAFDGALNSDMAIEAKILFAQRKVEFLEDLGSNIDKIQDAYNDLTKLTNAGSEKRKRALEEGGEDPLSKRARGELNGVGALTSANALALNSTGAAAATTDPAAAAAAYGYNWTGYPQNYNYQTTWNMYNQQYYQQQ